jgi:hypothetical protein
VGSGLVRGLLELASSPSLESLRHCPCIWFLLSRALCRPNGRPWLHLRQTCCHQMCVQVALQSLCRRASSATTCLARS